MRGYGGMITIYIKGDLESAKKFAQAVHLFILAESLGGVESLIEIPSLMTHLSGKYYMMNLKYQIFENSLSCKY
jgi:cystathionine gamma-lyase